MHLVSIFSNFFKKKTNNPKMDALEELRENCDKASILRFRSLCDSYIFTVRNQEDCDDSIAVAEYRKNIYAIVPVRGIKEYIVYRYFIREKLNNGSTVIVFSKKDLEEMIKYSNQGKYLNIILV